VELYRLCYIDNANRRGKIGAGTNFSKRKHVSELGHTPRHWSYGETPDQCLVSLRSQFHTPHWSVEQQH